MIKITFNQYHFCANKAHIFQDVYLGTVSYILYTMKCNVKIYHWFMIIYILSQWSPLIEVILLAARLAKEWKCHQLEAGTHLRFFSLFIFGYCTVIIFFSPFICYVLANKFSPSLYIFFAAIKLKYMFILINLLHKFMLKPNAFL